ncbi:MAG: decaprenyl-phosphate phosphoribosyltransferase [Patescibacteria group bacterium]|nr:decaprenyl-phosphate phosphoribosyltransferase [Patescibacteria group bacterium]
MDNLLYQIAVSARPRQWLKNGALFAALIFSGRLFIGVDLVRTLWAVVIFCVIASAIYIFNDIIDLQADRLHPFKKLRPIAKGAIPVPLAYFLAFTAGLGGLYLAFHLSLFFFLTCFVYLFLQIVYTLLFKNHVIIDILVIASGFVLRVIAGAFVIGVHLSGWFYLCVISFSLFMAVGKRRAELAILSENAAQHRKTLSLYSVSLLENYLSMFGASAFLSWSLFTFFAPPPVVAQDLSFLAYLPLTLAGINKWLMATIPVVLYGIMRYQKIVYEGERAESPEKVLLSDQPLLTAVLIWGLMVVIIVYGMPN